MFCSSRRRFRATVVFPFSVLSSSMERLSPVTSQDLISSWRTESSLKKTERSKVYRTLCTRICVLLLNNMQLFFFFFKLLKHFLDYHCGHEPVSIKVTSLAAVVKLFKGTSQHI